MRFEESVFINCPFDDQYLSLLRPMLFTVIYLGMTPRISSEAIDSGQARLEKIVEMIRVSKYGIHDLSRSQAQKKGEHFRLNMPFELGIDLGSRHFGKAEHKSKKILVLEAEPHKSKFSISDLSGCDLEAHKNDPYELIGIVRKWLINAASLNAVGTAKIESAFHDFMADNFEKLVAKGFSNRDIKNLSVPELIQCMKDWSIGKRDE
jgi:hypothetical protein